ncbi:MAG: hypothetical protein JW818_21770 [Pirellulales bacterium]|nr:hypothetical protein [Pirellulales bacterium]
MADVPDDLIYEGVSIDIAFEDPRPGFGDLYRICDDTPPHFPPTGPMDFSTVADLQFVQIDDYFGVPFLADDGDDVVVWLYPLVNGEPVHHYPGPFDGVRLDFCILRNPARHTEHYLRCVQEIAQFGAGIYYRNRKTKLGTPTDLSAVRSDIEKVVQHWAAQGITVGSDEALEMDY